MKLFKKFNLYYLFAPLLILFIVFSCEKTDDFTEDPDPNPILQGDPNLINESLSFKNGTTIQGTIPTNTSGLALKMDRDTIALVKDVEPFVGIKKADGSILQTSTAYIQVAGSDTYFEVEFEEIENDTLVYLNMDFDITDWQLPVTFDLNIVPIDDSGTPIDIITAPVIVEEELAQNSGNCSIEEFLNGKDFQTYRWIVTYDNVGLPVRRVYGEEFSVSQVVNGCCTSSGSYYGDCIGFPTHAMVTGETKTVIGSAYIRFFRDGAVAGSLWNKVTQNVDPINFDFCNGVPAYNISSITNHYVGTYTFNSANCTITIDNLIGDSDPIYDNNGNEIGQFPRPIHAGQGFNVTYLKLSDHTLLEEHSDVETGEDATYMQVYRREEE